MNQYSYQGKFIFKFQSIYIVTESARVNENSSKIDIRNIYTYIYDFTYTMDIRKRFDVTENIVQVSA